MGTEGELMLDEGGCKDGGRVEVHFRGSLALACFNNAHIAVCSSYFSRGFFCLACVVYLPWLRYSQFFTSFNKKAKTDHMGFLLPC